MTAAAQSAGGPGVSAPVPAPDASPVPGDPVPDGPARGPLGGPQDVGRWAEATRLRRDHRGWSIAWIPRAGEFHAYRRLPGARRDTGLAAATPAGLAAQIIRAEQAARTPRSAKGQP